MAMVTVTACPTSGSTAWPLHPTAAGEHRVTDTRLANTG